MTVREIMEKIEEIELVSREINLGHSDYRDQAVDLLDEYRELLLDKTVK